MSKILPCCPHLGRALLESYVLLVCSGRQTFLPSFVRRPCLVWLCTAQGCQSLAFCNLGSGEDPPTAPMSSFLVVEKELSPWASKTAPVCHSHHSVFPPAVSGYVFSVSSHCLPMRTEPTPVRPHLTISLVSGKAGMWGTLGDLLKSSKGD